MCLLVLFVAPALGKEVHVFRSSFGGEGTGAGRFDGPLGVAVSNATHDVYVVDGGNNRVEEFTAAGVYVGEFDGSGAPTGKFVEPAAIAIDNSSNPLDPSQGDEYVLDSGHGVIDKFDSSGNYLGTITGVEAHGGIFVKGETGNAVQGIAVDGNGTLLVSVAEGPIYSFNDGLTNSLTAEIQTAFGGAREGLGVDSEDDLYVHIGAGVFARTNDEGETLANPFGSDLNARQVAVDGGLGEVYLDNRDSVEAFTVGGEMVESFGTGRLTFSKGVAVDEGDGTVYASDRSSDTVSVFEAVLLPTVVLTARSDQLPKSVTLNGTVNPEGSPVTSCVFEYASSEEFLSTKVYGHSVHCSPTNLGSGTGLVAVSAHITGLSPEITYDYRLVAENSVSVPSSTPNTAFFTGPKLGGEFVTDVKSDSATLNAQVDPNGGDTHYYFEYGQDIRYGFYAPVSPPGADLGSVVGPQGLSAHVQGLAPDSTYHYRLVAEQGGEVFVEPDRVFNTQGVGTSALLPDGRDWELVSPADKRGSLLELFQVGGQVQAASDGSGIAYMTKSGSVNENPSGKVTYAQVLSKRSGNGWGTSDITLPGKLVENGEPSLTLNAYRPEYHLFSSDLSMAMVEPQNFGTPPLAAGVTERTLYIRNNDDDSFEPVVTGEKLEEPNFRGAVASEFEMHFLTATPDLAHVVFKTPMALTANAIDEESVHDVKGAVQWNLYETGDEGLGMVNVLPGHEGVAHGPAPLPGVRLAGVVSASGLGRGGAPRTISSDGRRIAWTWGEPYSPEGLDQYRGLYVRDMGEEKTLRVGGPSAVFQSMNSNGSKIFFLEDGDLYEFNYESDKQRDVTAAHGPGESSAGVQESVSDVSEDGSYVYLVARGVLAHGGQSGQNNLYLAHEIGSEWKTMFVAVLSAEDNPDWGTLADFGAPDLPLTDSRVSPDGRYLAFMSDRSLTGYDNIDAVSSEPDEEVFLYDSLTERLVCASCDPTGARPQGVFDTYGVDGQPPSELLVDRVEAWTGNESQPGDVRGNHWLAGSVPGWDELGGEPATYQPRYLGDDGRLFFDSPVGLVPQDTNGLEDVYEFEPDGSSSCNSEILDGSQVFVGEVDEHLVDGCVGLISSGTSSAESAFYDASVSGDDVFFTTTSKLVGEDYDKGYYVYDAHACSGTVPCLTPTVPPPPCTSGDSCKAAPAAQPTIFGAPPSATFNGTGNVNFTVSSGSVKHKSLTVKQKLSRALKACQKRRKRSQRASCERHARKQYRVLSKRRSNGKIRG